MITQSLLASRSTKLLQNTTENLKIYLTSTQSDTSLETGAIYIIIDEVIAPLNHMGIRAMEGFMVLIPSEGKYMVLNLSSMEITLKFSSDPHQHIILFDPYRFEGHPRKPIDPQVLLAQFSIPSDYIAILQKWYSVKFTYTDYNLIFLCPGWGISLQTHVLREEYWEILHGEPITIAGSKVTYYCIPGTKIAIPLGNKHTIMNPSETEWVLLKETYTGTFDEEDIARLFNPNQY